MIRSMLCWTLALGFGTASFAQTKFEKESRVKPEEVPVSAVQMIDGFNFNRKLKWYLEEDGDRRSYELKTKFQGKRYSIEFSEEGEFEDVEIGTKWKELEDELRRRIADYLSAELGNYKLDKIQVQYSGNAEDVRSFLLFGKESLTVSTRYEMVVSSKKDGGYLLFEYLFTESGTFLERRPISLRNTDNLEY